MDSKGKAARTRTKARRTSGGRCLGLLGLLAGCGDATTGAAPSGLVGDWFACFSPDCATLDRRGVRFESGGRYASLNAPREGWTPPGTYCLGASTAQRGTYTWDATTGTLQVVSDVGTVTVMAFTVDPSGRTATQTVRGEARPYSRITAAAGVVDCPP